MLALVALASILIADAPINPPLTDPASVQKAYQEARSGSRRSSDDQVRLAYWCEAHGLPAERMRHLTLALLADPGNAAARGLSGLVNRDGHWMRPEAVAERQRTDAALAATLAEYDTKRSATPYIADAQFSLGLWADDRGLKDQAKAHFTAAIRLDPAKDAAWKRLGYVKHDGRWMTDHQITLDKADAEAQKLADRKWKPLLEKWKAQLSRPSQKAGAEANLLGLTDPRAVPSVGKVFIASDPDQTRAAQLLGQIDAPGASRGLAYLAAFGTSAETQRVATETLRRRDPREYANLLIPFIHKLIRYEVKPVGGPNSPGVLYVEGQKANVRRLYEPRSLIQPTDRIAIDRFGQPVVERELSSWAYSKGGRPFNPGTLTGIGTSYDDFYTANNLLLGDLTTSSGGSPRLHINTQLDPTTARFEAMARGSSSVNDLAAGVRSIQKTNSAGNHQAHAAWISPTGMLLSNGAQIDPRDAAQRTTAEFPLAQAVDESFRSALASQQQLNNDVAQIERQNRSIQTMNDRVVGILNNATGQNLSDDRSVWERWWVDLLGYAFVAGQSEVNPTFVEVIPSGYQPEVSPSNVVRQGLYVSGISCFGAGTAVQTLTGPQPIETLKVGDLVLSQSTSTGALGYQPILVTHHNPPSSTFRIKLGNDVIVASHFHRFWVAGRGWVMARDLKAGDPVRTLGGIWAVDSVEAGKVELVYNLDVAEDADFFAGDSAALVHDNTLPDTRLVPFDTPAATTLKGVAAR